MSSIVLKKEECNSTLYDDVMEQNIFEELELTLGIEFDNYKLYTESGEYDDDEEDDEEEEEEEDYKVNLISINVYQIYGIDIEKIFISLEKSVKSSKYAKICLIIKKNKGNYLSSFTITKVNLKNEFLNYKNNIEKNLKLLLNMLNYNEIDEMFDTTRLSINKIQKIKNIINDNEDYQCSVCYNPTIFTTTCNHSLCKDCRSIVAFKPVCPICRKQFHNSIELIKQKLK